MDIRKLMVVVLAVCLFVTLGVNADDKASKLETNSKTASVKAASKVAEIVVPKLTKDHIAKMSEVLKDVKGIQSVKPDMEANTMLITYDSKIEFEKEVLPEIKKVDGEAKLKGIVDSKTGPTSKCGGCPQKAKCSKATKEASQEKTEKTKEAKNPGSCSGK